MLRLDLYGPLVGRLLLQVDVLDDAEDVVGVDDVLGRAARPPARRRRRREVRLLVAPRQRRPVIGGVVLRVEGAVSARFAGTQMVILNMRPRDDLNFCYLV